MKLSELITALGGAFPDGDGYVATCPAHEDTKPSLRIAMDDNGTVLISCRAGCSYNEVIMATEGINPADLFEVENDIGADTLPDQEAEISTDLYERLAEYVADATTDIDMAYSYMNRFGVEPELAHHWQIGWDDGKLAEQYPDLFGPVYARSERLVVPFWSPGEEILGLQARAIHDDSKAKWSGPSNPDTGGTWSKLAYFDSQSGMDWVVVTEGPGDAMTCAAAGGIDAIGIRGASMANAVLDDLAEWTEGRTVFLAGDKGPAGEKFNSNLSKGLALRNIQTHIVEISTEDDITEWFSSDREGFAAAFQSALSEAEGKPSTDTKEQARAKPLSSYVPTTDVGLAGYVLDESDDEIAYSQEMGFLVYEKGAWKRDTLNKTRRHVHKCAKKLHKLADDTLDADASGVIHSAANRLLASREIDKVIKELQVISTVDLDEFDQNNHLLVVGNGIVNLETGELEPHDKDILATQRVDFNYDPDAKCPRWIRFLEETHPNTAEEMAPFLQRLVGYGITGDTKEQCFVILQGLGANGKSVFTNTLGYVFDELTRVTPFSTFEQKPGGIPNDLAALHSARMVFAAEGERGKPMAEALIKRATGMDKLPARFLHREFFEYTPKFLLWLSTNHKPNFRSADDGLWRRIKLIPWTRFFAPEERDHYLEADLRQEAEGILAWAVAGSVEWHEKGLQDPASVRNATATYRENSDTLHDFFGPAGVFTERGNNVAAATVYKAYRVWAVDNDLTAKDTWGRNTFYNTMDERGFKRGTDDGKSVFLDIDINAELRKGIL